LLLAETLRNNLTKYRIVTHCGGGQFKNQLKKADKTGAKLALLLGKNEFDQQTVTVKWLQTGEQLIAQTELVTYLAQHFRSIRVSTHDDEQIENLKRFWQDYGTPILVGASIALAVFAGWRYWQQSELEQTASIAANAYQASQDAYQKLVANPEDKAANTDLQREAQKLMQDYTKTPYAANAALLLAKRAIDLKDFKRSRKTITFCVNSKNDDGLKSIATLRLAQYWPKKAIPKPL
jgi:predicted negative regulator of RcsB-dependent stress response